MDTKKIENAAPKGGQQQHNLLSKELLQSIPFAKWRHFKEAFSPSIVLDAIRCSGIQVGSCIDPFGGSGTTAVACQISGVVPTTIEVNPYLADLIEAKLVLYDTAHLSRDLASILFLADRLDPSKRLEQLPRTFVGPGVKNRWLFDKEVAYRILAIAQASEELELESHRRFFRVLLGGILVSLSNVIVNGKGRRYRSGWEKKHRSADDVDYFFTQSVTRAIQELRQYECRATSTYTLIRGDSRTALANLGPFDAAVFSPPYPNSFDYTDVYNIELWMLAYLRRSEENQALRRCTLSSHVQIKRHFTEAPTGSQQLDDAIEALLAKEKRLWNQYIPAMLGAYFAEMLNIIELLKSTLSPGGRMWIVVGDSSYVGIAINVASIIGELVRTRGLRVHRFETLRVMRKSAQQGGQNQLAENLLVIGAD